MYLYPLWRAVRTSGLVPDQEGQNGEERGRASRAGYRESQACSRKAWEPAGWRGTLAWGRGTSQLRGPCQVNREPRCVRRQCRRPACTGPLRKEGRVGGGQSRGQRARLGQGLGWGVGN